MKTRMQAFAVVAALGIAACSDQPVAPDAPALREGLSMQPQEGTGLVLESVTGITLPLIGQLGDVVIDQVVLTNFALVEDVVGQIVGLEVEGVLQLTGGVLGTDVITEDFLTTVTVTSSGFGKCDILTIDLSGITVDALVASVDIPAATVSARGSGAVGSLLCALGQLLGGLTGGGGALPGAGGIVDAINNQI